VFCSEARPLAAQRQLAAQDVEVIALPTLEPLVVLEVLHQRGLRSVLWECGGQLAARAIAQGCVQKICAIVAPKIIGGTAAPTPIGELGLTAMTAAKALRDVTFEQIGTDMLIQGYLPSFDDPA
ncbi:MAG TPA: dihydrofolate reductase family protein, partial [Candidatus Obscuribacterales bacterium]